ncbi:MAG: nucleotidyltransferase domain-containing protein [Candidatus Omnitrophica bacterium]|nr:nucleotidyltransferase domain-containing protein [Candidatus Omnitrophota bacterium]
MLKTRSNVKNKVLNYFFLNEEGAVYINELARLIRSDPKNVYRVLVQLEQEGLLKSEFKGKERYFSSHTQHPLYKNYKDIFLKTAGLEQVLRERLKAVAGLQEAYLYGSYAQGAWGPSSDVDLLLVGEHKGIEAQKVLYRMQKEAGREINAVNIRPEDFRKRKKSKDQFLQSVFEKKVIRLL